MDTTQYGIGQPVRRVEDRRFLTGRGRYVDDLAFDRLAHAVAVMSPHAHARIVHIDVSQALAVAGVLCVLTGRDALAEGLGDFPPLNMPEDQGGPKGFRAPRPMPLSPKRSTWCGCGWKTTASRPIRSSRVAASACTTQRPQATPSTPARRTLTGCAPCWRARCSAFRKPACGWSRPTWAEASV